MAGAITLGMAVYSSKTYSARLFRQVDTLRLIVDGVDGLQSSITDSDIATLPTSDLEEWAAQYQVVYSKIENRVKLSRVGE